MADALEPLEEQLAANGLAGGGCLDDYVVEKAIGRGHFSVVHRAVRKSDGLRVALKKVQIFDMMDAKARDRCLKEVHLLRTLPKHPCIITYLDSFIDNNELLIIFEWAQHGDLRRLLRRAQEANATLQERQIWDIKPANIFLAADGRVKLGDLGLGRAFSSQTYEANSKVGTPLYMSPEVLDGRGYEWKSDIWSLGCLLYELATLRSPFKNEGDNLYTLFKKISVGKYKELPPTYSPQLSRLVSSMIQIDPKQRPDIHSALKYASLALAGFNEGGPQPTIGAAVSSAQMEGSNGVSECLAVMEAVLDKLKLLDYERGLLRPTNLHPLPRWYFCGCGATTAAVGFHYFYSLCCWLLEREGSCKHQLWRHLPAATSSAFEADALSACNALLDHLKNSGPPLNSYAAMPAHRLRGASGAEVCALLNALTDVALVGTGFTWGTPSHAPGFKLDLEEEEDDEIDEETTNAALVEDAVGEADVGEEVTEEGPGDRWLLPISQTSVEAATWHEECARVAPQLEFKLLMSQAQWRHRLALARQIAPTFGDGLPLLSPALEAVDAQAILQQQAVAPLRASHEQANRALEAASTRVADAQQKLSSLSAELSQLENQLQINQEALSSREAQLAQSEPLDKIRSSVRVLRLEVKQLTLQESLMQQEVLSKRQNRLF
ncbi:MAG: hypothetical protein SGPRY_011199 [Prymnesium sp.]